MIIYHGSNCIVRNPEVRVKGHYKDYGYGFYCTDNYHQAKSWAKRKVGKSYISTFEYVPNNNLNNLDLQGEEKLQDWLDFAAHCRNGGTHEYDIVVGPLVDDRLYNFVNDYLNGTLSRDQFLALAQFNRSTHQISFHTEASLKTIRFIGGELIDSF